MKYQPRHGDSSDGTKHPIYNAYLHMIERCYKPNTKQYHRYGGKGIYVCEEWKNSYAKFKEWSLNNGWKKGLEIDKDIMSNGNNMYSPETCKWVTHIENMQYTERASGKTGIKYISQDKRKAKVGNKSFFGQRNIMGVRYATSYFHTPEEAEVELKNKIGVI